MNLVFQFFPKLFSGVEVAGKSISSTSNLVNHVFVDLTLCTVVLSCWNKLGLGHLVPINGNLNSTAQKDNKVICYALSSYINSYALFTICASSDLGQEMFGSHPKFVWSITEVLVLCTVYWLFCKHP